MKKSIDHFYDDFQPIRAIPFRDQGRGFGLSIVAGSAEHRDAEVGARI